jgi:hypothetical protein
MGNQCDQEAEQGGSALQGLLNQTEDTLSRGLLQNTSRLHVCSVATVSATHTSGCRSASSPYRSFIFRVVPLCKADRPAYLQRVAKKAAISSGLQPLTTSTMGSEGATDPVRSGSAVCHCSASLVANAA